MKIENLQEVEFTHLICYSGYFTSPYEVKEKVDHLINTLKDKEVRHLNKVVSRVVKREIRSQSNLLLMEIMIPCDRKPHDWDGVSDEYKYVDQYAIGQALKVSIPNNPKSFQKAVNTLNAYSKDHDLVTTGPIIEISKIDLYGNVIGFDLLLEYENKRSRDHADIK